MHPATCLVWENGSRSECDCGSTADRGYRIQKHPTQQFAWRIFRHTHDGEYVKLMGCSTFEAARQMVVQLMWLRDNALTEDQRHVR